jgi:predicted GTPase
VSRPGSLGSAAINATDCDVVVTGTPIDLGRLIDIRHPVRHVTYEYGDHGRPTLPRC